MEKEAQDSTSSNQSNSERNEPVRSRWNPKPEQILILESIFNSGMVNPPKDETVRIRKILEQFGAVGDANVFYWFQNRRSRSRRRQRQIQASLNATSDNSRNGGEQAAKCSNGGAIHFDTSTGNFGPSSISFPMAAPSNYLVLGSSSSCCGGDMGNANDGTDGLFPFSGQMGLPKIEQNSSVSSILSSPEDNANLHYQTGFITVFINGVATEVPRGPLDMKSMFGQEDLALYHSSGVPVPVNEFGFVVQSLQHGESYFLVSRPA
ncbi:PREDICTED: WUSCHEL-related homeobox 11 isoform X3 [Nicotiana attenuata]|uniref:Protein WUSCHEL n=1 Tax=Nicotiana attenuata TaxID=49451 RepID=A0A1J6KGP0_NICAT|nr:PREDICTED: WUSCHEL-related homeobox 11 isoform X3 [Nicotiana attenuata]OIT21063.1 wuschel-related homeobox 11 [Nicotiana attenuata]